MKLDKKGYLSENRGSFATAMKVLTLIFVVGVVVAAVCVYAMFSGCGSNGSGDGEPVYDENGVCVQNCGTASDGSVYPPGDTCDHDGCGFQPQKDYVAPPCHVPTDPKIKKWCMPQAYKDASCYKFDGACEDGGIPCFETDGWTPLHCVSDKANCTNGLTSMCSPYPINKECASDKDCSVPCEEWPPEVCQGLPCQLVGKWDCDGYLDDLTDLEFYDNGDGYCRIHDPSDPNDDLYYKPDGDHLQAPPSGPAEQKYTFLDGGSQIQAEGPAGPFNCTKLTEE